MDGCWQVWWMKVRRPVGSLSFQGSWEVARRNLDLWVYRGGKMGAIGWLELPNKWVWRDAQAVSWKHVGLWGYFVEVGKFSPFPEISRVSRTSSGPLSPSVTTITCSFTVQIQQHLSWVPWWPILVTYSSSPPECMTSANTSVMQDAWHLTALTIII